MIPGLLHKFQAPIMSTWLGKVTNFLPQSSSPPQPSTRQDNQREKKTVLMTLGGCTFTSANGRYKCPCEVASYISSTGAIEMNALCADCQHSLSVHADYGNTIVPLDSWRVGILMLVYSTTSSFNCIRPWPCISDIISSQTAFCFPVIVFHGTS